MLTTILSSIRAHAGRLFASALAISLGVAFAVGTLIFTDTLKVAMIQSFAQGDQGIDVAVLPPQATTPNQSGHGGGDGESKIIHYLAPGILTQVQGISGVKSASGQLIGPAVILDKAGHPYGGRGNSFGVGVPSDPSFKWIKVLSGTRPNTSSQVDLDSNTVATLGLNIGSTITVVGKSGLPQKFQVVGIISVGLTQAFNGSSIIGFTPSEAASVTGQAGFREIDVIAAPGVDQTILSNRIASILGPNATVETGATKTFNDENAVIKRANAIENALLTFAVIAILVASIVIANTFRVLVTQRSRELALLRCLGATRNQVFKAIISESFATGVVASGIGLALGVLVAIGLHGIFGAFRGGGIPSAPIQVTVRTFIIGILVGVVTTMAASVLPARNATRVSPLQALHHHSDTSFGGALTVKRLATSVSLIAVGVLIIVTNLGANASLPLIAVGGALAFVGLLIFAPLLVRPVMTVLGIPTRIFGTTGKLATLNTIRNPSRTASTSAALTIGLALISLFSVISSSLNASIDSTIAKNFPFDFVVTTALRGTTVPSSIATSANKTNLFKYVNEVRSGQAIVNGKSQDISGVTPVLLSQSQLMITSGSLANFGASGTAVISTSLAKNLHVKVGEPITISGGLSTATALPPPSTSTVVAISNNLAFLSNLVIPVTDFAPRFPGVGDDELFLTAMPGVTLVQARAQLQKEIDPYPLVTSQDIGTFESNLSNKIGQILALFTALLALALLISFIGIANTLTLSVVERTRELGLLRALGLTRPQVAYMLALEGMLLAVMGAVLGVAIGIAASWGIVLVLNAQGVTVFSVPISLLIVDVVVAALAGILASLIPARRAANTAPVVALAIEE